MTFRTKTTHFFDYGDLEQEIKKVFSLDSFEITESPNDTDYSFDVERNPLDEYQQKNLEKAMAQKWCEHWRIHVFLNELCNRAIIDPGSYVMKVCW